MCAHTLAAHSCPSLAQPAGGQAASGMLVSAGADGTLAITDPRTWGLVEQVRLSNFPYSLIAAGGLALAGLGDGSVWVVQCSTGKVSGGSGRGVRPAACCAGERGTHR